MVAISGCGNGSRDRVALHREGEKVLIEDTERYYVHTPDGGVISVDELVHLVEEYEYKLAATEAVNFMKK